MFEPRDRGQKDSKINLLLSSVRNPDGFLTLGGSKLYCVKMFMDRFGALPVTSIEYREDVFRKQQAIATPNVRLLRGTFYDRVQNLIIPKLVFADVMGKYSKSMELNFIALLSKPIQCGTTIGVTVCVSRDGASTVDGTYGYNKTCNKNYNSYKKNRATIIPDAFIYIGRCFGHKFQFLNPGNTDYKNGTGRSQAMAFYLFQKENEWQSQTKQGAAS
jgi:hypothetical protein